MAVQKNWSGNFAYKRFSCLLYLYNLAVAYIRKIEVDVNFSFFKFSRVNKLQSLQLTCSLQLSELLSCIQKQGEKSAVLAGLLFRTLSASAVVAACIFM